LGALQRLEGTAEKFRVQLEGMLGRNPDYESVCARIKAAHLWFASALEQEVLEPLAAHYKAWGIKPRTKKYLAELHMLEATALQTKKAWQQAEWLATGLAGGRPLAEIKLDAPQEASRLTTAAPEAAPKPKKGDTYAITLAMHREGKSAAEIAAERGMAESTIEGHLIRFIGAGEIPLGDIVSPAQMEAIAAALKRHEGPGSLSAVKLELGDEYTFGMIRAVASHLAAQKKEAVAEG
jgi:hypothetical protein